jgi:dTDP-4-dehydrorhamnose 3,5-epimerase
MTSSNQKSLFLMQKIILELPFEFENLILKGLVLVKPKVFQDEGGFFLESYKKDEFEKAGISGEFVQHNHSGSVRGVLRGLHFQLEPFSQAKLVRCVRGEIFDVAVDLRRSSPTFGKHVSVILSERNRYELYIPRGFAHGFQVLSEWAEVVYSVDNVYSPKHEAGVLWCDPELGIKWPIEKPILSERDKKWPTLRELAKILQKSLVLGKCYFTV